MKLHAGSDVQRAAWGQKQRAEASSYANWTTLQNGKMAKFCKDFVHLEFLYNMLIVIMPDYDILTYILKWHACFLKTPPCASSHEE